MGINEIEEIFTKSELPQTWELSQAETVINVPMFIDSHISILRANPGNARFKPYYDRLLKLAIDISGK